MLDGANPVIEAVTHLRLGISRRFLIHPLPQLIGREDAFTIDIEIYYRAGFSPTEEIQGFLNQAQRYRDQGFDRSTFDPPTFLTTGRAQLSRLSSCRLLLIHRNYRLVRLGRAALIHTTNYLHWNRIIHGMYHPFASTVTFHPNCQRKPIFHPTQGWERILGE